MLLYWINEFDFFSYNFFDLCPIVLNHHHYCCWQFFFCKMTDYFSFMIDVCACVYVFNESIDDKVFFFDYLIVLINRHTHRQNKFLRFFFTFQNNLLVITIQVFFFGFFASLDMKIPFIIIRYLGRKKIFLIQSTN